jgi:hypothetical protein
VDCDPYEPVNPPPKVYIPPALTGVEAQRRAHAVAMWIFGASADPLATYPQYTGTATDWSNFRAQIDRLRELVTNYKTNQADGWCAANSGPSLQLPGTAPLYNASGSPYAPNWQPNPAYVQVPSAHYFLFCGNLSAADKDMLLGETASFAGQATNSYGLQANMRRVWKGVQAYWHEDCSIFNEYNGKWSNGGYPMLIDPEPARLDGNLNGTNSWSYATYTNTNSSTYGFYVPKTWTSSWVYASYVGYPCADYNATTNTFLPGYVIASGNYRRCSTY